MKIKKKNRNEGFTLIELLVVIAIIAILSSIVFAALASAAQKAEGASLEQQTTEVVDAINEFFIDHGYYPTPPDNNYYCLTNPNPQDNQNTCGNVYSSDLINQIMPYFDLTTLFNNSTLNKYDGLDYFCGGFGPSGHCDIAKMFYVLPGDSCVLNNAINEVSTNGITLCLYQFPISSD